MPTMKRKFSRYSSLVKLQTSKYKEDEWSEKTEEIENQYTILSLVNLFLDCLELSDDLFTRRWRNLFYIFINCSTRWTYHLGRIITPYYIHPKENKLILTRTCVSTIIRKRPKPALNDKSKKSKK